MLGKSFRVAWYTVFAAAGLLSSHAASAQDWVPQRHVGLVVPGGAGGSLDVTARTVHRIWDELKLLPVTNTVVNKGGGGHLIGYEYVRQHTGDPHYLGLATSVLLSGHIAGYVPFTYTDVTPIAFLVTEYIAFAVRADSPIKTGRDLIEVLKKDAASLSFGMGGTRGGTYHIAAGLPFQSAGVDIKPIKMAFFAGQHATQLLGGHVDVAVGGLANVIPHVESGKLRLIAVSTSKRLEGVLASVPTWEELGFQGTYGSRRSIFAPKGITAEQVAYWEGVLRKVVESEDFRRTAEKYQWDVTFKGAAETRKFMEQEYVQLKRVMTYLELAKRQ